MGKLSSIMPDRPTKSQLTLKYVQIILYISSFLFSLFVCVPVAVTVRDFKTKCILYTTPKINTKLQNGSLHSVPEIDPWADMKTCTYVTYTNILTCIYSIVWCGIFLLVSASDDSDKRLPKTPSKNAYLVETHLKSEKVIFPGLLFNAVVFTFELIGSCVLTLGLKHWCNAIESANSEGRYTCESAQRLGTWVTIDPPDINGSRYYILLTIAEVSQWLCTLTTGALSIISTERFCRTIWAPSFRYTIRYENGLVGMDLRTSLESRYKAIDNELDTNSIIAHQEIESIEERQTTSTLRRNSSLTDALSNPKQRDPWNSERQPFSSCTTNNEHQPLRKKYIVVYSQPPGIKDPEDMQLISTV